MCSLIILLYWMNTEVIKSDTLKGSSTTFIERHNEIINVLSIMQSEAFDYQG